jgi:hypothetical protein
MRYFLYILLLLVLPVLTRAQFNQEVGLSAGAGMTHVVHQTPFSPVKDGPVFRLLLDANFDTREKPLYFMLGFRLSANNAISSYFGVGGVASAQYNTQLNRNLSFRFGLGGGPIAEFYGNFQGGKINFLSELNSGFFFREKYYFGIVYQQPFLPYNAWDGSYYEGSSFMVSNLMIEFKSRLRPR